jgi:hypothetical protein
MSKQRDNLNDLHRTIIRIIENSLNRNPRLFSGCLCIEILDASDTVIASEVFATIAASDIREWIESKYVVLSDKSDWSIKVF